MLPFKFVNPARGPAPAYNVPAPMIALVGREREVVALATLLRRPDVRLVTLTGPGGVGKTRLAVQVAAELLGQFPGGIYFVSLASIADPQLVLSLIAQTLEVRETGEQALVDRLAADLHGRKPLLILDNFEQVIAAASQVKQLLLMCPALKVLVTSRAALGVAGEYEFDLRPLALPDCPRLLASGTDYVASLARVEAVSLFCQRATAIQYDFQLSPANARAVAELCIHLDGLPLAIELAAAQVRLFSPQAILDRLVMDPGQQALGWLHSNDMDQPERHRRLWNTIEWSYRLLSPDEQQLFCRLAVFAGGCTLEAAEAIGDWRPEIGDRGSMLDLIAALVDQSLLRQVERPDGTPRLVMLETIREYGMAQLVASGEADEIRARHAAYFLALAEQAEPKVRGAERDVWLDRLEAEHANLRSALSWSLSRKDEGGRRKDEIQKDLFLHPSSFILHPSEIALRLVASLAWFWFFRGYLSEGWRWIERILDREVSHSGPASQTAPATASSDRARTRAPELESGQAQSLIARVLLGAGLLAWSRVDGAATRTRLEASVALWRDLGDRNLPNGPSSGLAYALVFLGLALLNAGETRAAVAVSEESAALFRMVGDDWGLALALGNLARGSSRLGKVQAARAYGERSLALARQEGDPWGVAWALNGLGLVVYRQGENALAEALLSEAAAIQRVQRDHRGLALSLGYLGEIQRCHGNYRRAKSLYEESLTFAEELDIKPYRAVLLCNLAQVSLRLGDLAKAIKLCECSLDLTEKAGYQPQFPLCLSALAGIAIQSDQPRRAILLLAAAQAQLKALGIALEPADQAEYDRTLAAVRAGLDQDVFVTAWAQGLAMTQEQSLAYAWQHLPLPENGRAELSLPVPVRLAGLTDREVEVLALAAQGLSNRQIAERLVLSQRTVETYMSSIYTKLKTTSRTDAICFAIEHRL